MALIDSKTASEMQAAIDGVYNRLPKCLQTKAIKNEMAKSVAACSGNYEVAAIESALQSFQKFEEEHFRKR